VFVTYDAIASGYDEFVGVSCVHRVAIPSILSLCGEGSSVLDVACGQGALTRELARRFAAGLASLGRSAHLIQHLSNVAVDYQNGIFSGTNNLIELIGNHPPMTVEEFVIDRKQVFDRSGPRFVPAKPG
jgi:hypothetical protein